LWMFPNKRKKRRKKAAQIGNNVRARVFNARLLAQDHSIPEGYIYIWTCPSK
jgi:hypothetical protein